MSTNFGKNYKWTERDRITWETDIDKKDNYEYDYEEPIVDPRYYDYLKGYSDLPHRSLADRLRHKKPTIYGRSREGRRLYGPANISDLGMPTNFNFKREWIADKLLIEEALNVEFKQLLGEGAFGQVWRVRVVANRTHYAAKVLELRRFATDKNANVRESMKQMLLEVDAVRGLQHPNLTRIEIVLHVRDAVTDFPSAFVVIFMELCDGSLEDEIYYRPNHQMTEREARDWFFQIIGALKYLHENRVAHMDIKPENILVQKQPQAVYKLADLGLALTFQPNEPMLTNDRLLGTPGFLAPELVYQDALSIRKLLGMSNRHKATVCDVYSLGITLAVSLGGASRFSHYLNPQHGMTLNLNAYMRDTLLRPDGRFSETDDVITLLKVLTLFTHRLANNRLTNTT
ncbi:death-associated protein kinase 3-like isoform X2 [Oppia nitens]|uniref:death-associated protein kinase 3-like isoform X2 n=1 Tax=Oppia nitens TaxID=1686743 RepID=UPI0023DABA53|nr:death-associated protein kinase 3-like isoform X2 [Oppia nitens]